MFLTKTKTGYWIPSSDADYEENKKIPIGMELKVSPARNVKFHRKAFALLNLGFENQDTYEKFEIYRKIITIRSGYYDEVIDKRGVLHFLPKSLSFEVMSAETFEKWYNDTLNVIAEDTDTLPEKIKSEIEKFF